MISELNILQRFNSTDTGAPTADDTVEGTINVLKKVLVDGYDSTPPAGWSILFESSDSLVLQTARADYCYKVYPATRFDSGLAMHGYDSMSDISSGVNRMPNISSDGSKYSGSSAPTMPKLSDDWVIFANEFCCYVITNAVCAFIGVLDTLGANPNCLSGGFHGWNNTRFDRGFPFGNSSYFNVYIRAIGGGNFVKATPNHYSYDVSRVKVAGESDLLFQCCFTINDTNAYFPGMFGAFLNSLNSDTVEGYKFYKYKRENSWNSDANGEVYLCHS
ncbi:hypothetical protein [Pseudoalteromonas byunsanensis]|uniref:Uncharacterized protein n=1 Tax=Pseudoalteromonas byunsanensis TaxID=327939 RepID=A0A1S1NC03_9GAMM|nr:hypothetical protein [Pseudoalteromonas byunsanensis]OHU97140.1 hypothetical protein BIW53_02130 [Pseudoalteromonas byunsanensis]